jgi:hypothetical protein
MNMKSSVKLRPCLWDGIVVLAVAALAVVLAVALMQQAGASTGGLTCTVTQNGKVLKSIVLTDIAADKQETYTVKGDCTAVIQMENDRVRVKSSTCASQDCVHTGWISKAGQSIVCLPNRLVITLSGSSSASGSSSSGVDVVLGQKQ